MTDGEGRPRLASRAELMALLEGVSRTQVAVEEQDTRQIADSVILNGANYAVATHYFVAHLLHQVCECIKVC